MILIKKEGGDFILLYEIDFTSFHSKLILVNQHPYIIEKYITLAPNRITKQLDY